MANTAKAQAIFKEMTPEQQQAFLNKQKTASAWDQAKVSAALSPMKPVTPPAATTSTTATSGAVPTGVSSTPIAPQDNTVWPAEPVTPQIDKAKVAWARMNADQQQEFAKKHQFDPAKYWLEFAKATTKPQTPTQPTGQTQQTTPMAPTTPEATQAVTTQQPNYQDNSTARLQEIRNNLDQQLQAAPSLFNDRMAFDATFNYALRSKEQQAVLNNFWYQKSQSDVFNNTPTDVLANSIASNQTSIDAFSFMKDKDPVKYAALQAAVTEANKRESLKASLDPKKFLEDFNKKYDESIARIDEQQALINTEELLPAITKSKEELAGLKSEIDQIELDKAKIEAEVLAEYEGKGISKGLLNEIINDRQQTLIDQGNSKILQYNSKLGGLNAKMDEMKMYNDLEKERTDMDRQLLVDTLSTYQTLSWVFNQYVNQEIAQEELDLKKYPVTEDKNIGKTVDLWTAKSPRVMLWNTATQSYDIPLNSWGTSGWWSGSGNAVMGLKSTDSNDVIVKTILASAAFTKQQKQDLINGINAWGDVKAIALNQAKNIMGQTLATSVTKSEQALAQMNSLDGLIKEYYKNWGDTWVFKGNFESALNRVWQVDDPKLVWIAAQIAKALQIYRNSVSGTAFSVQEWADIASIFPGINKSSGLNKALIDAQKAALENDIDTAYRNTLWGSYDTIKAVDQTPATPPPVSPKKEEAKAKLEALKAQASWTITPNTKKSMTQTLKDLFNF